MADRDLRINIEAKTTGRSDVVQLRQEMQRFENTIDELRASVRQSEDAFEAARATSIALKSEYKQLNREGKGTREMFESLSQQIEKSQAAELEAISSTRKLIAELNQLDSETGEVGNEFSDLGQRLNEAEGWITGVTQEVRTMGAGFQNVSGDVQEVGNKVDKLGDDTRRAADGIDKLGDESRRAADGIDKLGDDSKRSADGINKLADGAVKFSAIGNIIADAVQDGARAVVEFLKDSTQAFYDFDRSSREVFTLIPGASATMREALQKDALALGTDLGRLPDEILPAIYAGLSAGIPQENILDTVRTASDAARAGVADLDSTLKLGLGILNAQVGGVSNLSEVYDQLFFIVKNGVITLPEMNDVMSQVTSVAGEAGVSLQDISAAMIVMTRQGDSAAEAAELLSLVLTQLSTSGTQLAVAFETAAGKSFRQFIAEGGNLAGAMQVLQDHADNTGQAMADMLGGSKFYRDSQASRGALELTGKHLEDLIAFSEEAENQMGAMAEAGAEMGEAAELGALRGKAAFEEFKIALGEAAAEAAGPLLGNLTLVMQLLSGNKSNEVDRLTSQIVEQVKVTENYEDAAQRLAAALKEAYSTEGRAVVDDKTRQDLNDSLNEVYVLMARNSGSAEEFQAALDGLDVSNLYKPANAQELFDNAKAEQFADSLANIDAKMMNVAATATELADKPTVFSPEQLAEMSVGLDSVDAKLLTLAETAVSPSFSESVRISQEMIAANQEIAATAEERAARIAAAAAAEQAAIMASREAYNGYALGMLNGAEAETNWTDALFQTAGQMGINQSQFRTLAEASGEYSEAQIRAALTEAAMRQAVEELSGKLADGTITVGEAIQSMNDFKDALANDYTATLEFSDFEEAEAQARATKDALLAAEGDYSATFTTTNTTVNQVVNVPATGQPGGGQSAVANYKGGTFAAGQWMIVGDGPGGQILPTTELVVFDQPGRVFSGQETARILGQSGPGEPDFGSGAAASARNGDAAAAAEMARPINVYLTLPNVRDGQQFVGELDQALKALQRAGVAN